MAAFQGEGYANSRARKFDPLLGAHPFDRTRLLTDRSAYVSFLEVQLERVTAACLATQGFSDRIDQLQTQIAALEQRSVPSRPVEKFSPCTCQSTCARLADDALAAVQALDARVDKAEGNFQQKISDHSARILDLLRRVILKQKDMQLKISGNLEISDTSLPVTADVTPVSTLRPTEGARKRAVSVPGAAAAQARRRKALDELLHELDSLEKESN